MRFQFLNSILIFPQSVLCVLKISQEDSHMTLLVYGLLGLLSDLLSLTVSVPRRKFHAVLRDNSLRVRKEVLVMLVYKSVFDRDSLALMLLQQNILSTN
jgi:hypothetical protein